MRKDKLITINSKTSKVFIENSVLGVDNENLQGNLIFSFDDEFVDGTARLEIEIKGTKSYTMLTKEEETYTLPIKSFLTKEGKVNMQLVITEGEDPEEIPIFKSNIFWLVVNSSINAEIEQPEEYAQWIDVANEKLNELDDAIEEANNLDIEVEKIDNTTTVTITKKDGTTEEVEILDGEAGQDGRDGADAKINGVNTLTIEAGDNIELDQEGSTLTISATGGGGGGTSNYNDLSNKPKINNVELSGNKTTSDLGIVIPDVSNFITKDANNLTYYTKTSDLSSVATSGNYNDLTNKPNLNNYQTKIDSSNKLSSDLIDDTNNTNKFVTANDKTTWSGKQDALISGTNIKTINNTSILGSGNIEVASSIDIDESSITLNNDDELQAVGVIDNNTTNTNKFWTGTLQQYNAIQNKDSNTFYNITDDYVNNGVISGGTTGQVLAKASNTDYDTEWTSLHNFTHETWTFTLDDDSTIDKEVVLW